MIPILHFTLLSAFQTHTTTAPNTHLKTTLEHLPYYRDQGRLSSQHLRRRVIRAPFPVRGMRLEQFFPESIEQLIVFRLPLFPELVRVDEMLNCHCVSVGAAGAVECEAIVGLVVVLVAE